MTPYLKQHGQKVLDNGYSIIPIKKGYKHPKGLKDWQSIKATPNHIESWVNNGFSDGGVGVLTEQTPAVDIDVNDEVITKLMVEFTEKLLGKTLKRVGLPPKVLLTYRTDKPFTKITSSTYEDFLGQTHKVEVLGKGQQFVAFAMHPKTKRPYRWHQNKSILNTKHQDLPVINQEQAKQIVDYFESIVPDDWEKVIEASSSKQTTDPFENFKSPADISPEKVIKTLSLLDPDNSYDHWVKTGMAIYHQFNGDAEGFQIWDEWSSKGAKYQEGETREKWNSLRPNLKNTNPITFSSVIRWAKKEYKNKKAEDQPFKMVDFNDTLKKLGPIDWTVKGYLESDTTGLFFGDPGCYKSFLALDVGIHCAIGKKWNGCEVKQGPVIYLVGEGHGGYARRNGAWIKHHDTEVPRGAFSFSERAADIYNEESAELVTKSINATVGKGAKPVLIVLDTLARNFGSGDENSTSDMNVFIEHVDRYLRAPYGCTVLIVHHTGHQNKQRARGAMALKGGVDFEYRIERPGALSASMYCTKMKDAVEPEDTFFKGQNVLLKMVGDEEISSLVFEKTDSPVQVKEEKPLKGKQKELYELLLTMTEDQEWVSRELFKEAAIDQEVVKNKQDFIKTIFELKQKGFVEEENKEVKPAEPFSK